LFSSAEATLEASPLREGRITPLGAVTVGGTWLRASGLATPPYQGLTGDVFSAAIGARVGVGVRLVGRLRLRVDGGASALVPRPRVLFAGRAAGAATEPLPEVGGALELDAW
jgi:hypothetical protein